MRNKLRIKKIAFLILGIICLILAYIGIVLPGFPGTPFILLTGYFFFKSSDRMYNWLMKQKLFARFIHEFESNPVISLKLKILVLIPFWISILVAEIFLIHTLINRLSLGLIAILVSVLVLVFQKTLK